MEATPAQATPCAPDAGVPPVSLGAGMVVSAHGRSFTDRVVLPIGRVLVAVGLTANSITVLGLVLVLAGMAVVVLTGERFWGAALAGLGSVLDALDGTVARLRGTSGHLGAFVDSVTDRISDAAMFGVVSWLVRDDPLTFAVVVVALGAAQVTSYIRAKAEALGWDASVGLVERPERLLVLLCGLGLGFLEVAAWALAAGGLVTVAQRWVAVVRQARVDVPAPKGPAR